MSLVVHRDARSSRSWGKTPVHLRDGRVEGWMGGNQAEVHLRDGRVEGWMGGNQAEV
jgi:hypothetical protein